MASATVKNGIGHITGTIGKYSGGIKDGKEHGKGKKSYTDGDVYEGDFKDGNFHERLEQKLEVVELEQIKAKQKEEQRLKLEKVEKDKAERERAADKEKETAESFNNDDEKQKMVSTD